MAVEDRSRQPCPRTQNTRVTEPLPDPPTASAPAHPPRPRIGGPPRCARCDPRSTRRCRCPQEPPGARDARRRLASLAAPPHPGPPSVIWSVSHRGRSCSAIGMSSPPGPARPQISGEPSSSTPSGTCTKRTPRSRAAATTRSASQLPSKRRSGGSRSTTVTVRPKSAQVEAISMPRSRRRRRSPTRPRRSGTPGRSRRRWSAQRAPRSGPGRPAAGRGRRWR